jgi:pimeloyl-ACP methyl ester carboxylesterase
VREFHVFVPFGPEHLATTVTVPDAEPGGLVLLMTGLGAHRSHKFGVWTRTARTLAERGIASARFEYVGVGESTGILGEWPMVRVPVAQAREVMRFAVRATGATRVAVVGNCVGAWTALVLAAETPGCAGVGFISAPILSTGMGSLAKRARKSRFGSVIRHHPIMRRAAVTALANDPTMTLDPLGAYRAVLARHDARILMLFGQEDHALNHRVLAQLDVLRRRLAPGELERLELRVAAGRSIHGLDSVAAQSFVIDAVSDWATDMLENLPIVGEMLDPSPA